MNAKKTPVIFFEEADYIAGGRSGQWEVYLTAAKDCEQEVWFRKLMAQQ